MGWSPLVACREWVSYTMASSMQWCWHTVEGGDRPVTDSPMASNRGVLARVVGIS